MVLVSDCPSPVPDSAVPCRSANVGSRIGWYCLRAIALPVVCGAGCSVQVSVAIAASPIADPRRDAAIVRLAQASDAEAPASDAPSGDTPSVEELPTLRQGDAGATVEELQRQLQAIGLYEGDIDGDFNSALAMAVEAFQEAQGLTVDGVVGTSTWEALAAAQPASSAEEANPSADAGEGANEGGDAEDANEGGGAENANENADAADSGGLGLIWWGAALVAFVIVAGGLFVLLLKVFRDDYEDYDETEEAEAEENAETAVASPAVAASEDTPTPQAFPDPPAESMPTPTVEERAQHVAPETTQDAPKDDPKNDPKDAPPNNANGASAEVGGDVPHVVLPNADTPTDAPADPTAGAIARQSKPEAVEALTRLPRMSIVEALILDLQHPDPQRRQKAIWELGQRGDSRAIAPLVDLLVDSDSQERSIILAVLSEIGTRTLRPMKQALMLSLQDDSAEVRKNAIRDLTRIYDSIAQLSQVLRFGIEDSDAEVRETAKWAMSQLQRIRTLPPGDDRRDGG